MTVSRHTSESALLLKLRDGDYAAFTEIYNRYKTPLIRNLLLLLKDNNLVEDVLQEVFSRLWVKREAIDPEQPIGGFLYRIAANLSYDHFRRLAKDRRAKEAIIPITQQYHLPVQEQLHNDTDEALYKLIDQLPPQRRRVYILCKLRSKSYREVGDLLQISKDAVKDHIIKANKFLKDHYYNTLPITELIGMSLGLFFINSISQG